MLGHTKDMNDSHTEALQALLNSLALKGPDTSPSSKLTPLQLKHLVNKIDEILGGASDGEGFQRNEKGELLNEEGLPIIDITEPAVDISDVHSPAASFREPDLISESSLSASEREQRRRTRDHILDMLEEEERLQSERDEVEEREKRMEDIHKLREATKTSANPSSPDESLPHRSYTLGSDSDDESDDGLLEEEFDWDSAQHHREIALEYYKKRHAIGAEAAQAMASHTHDDEECNQGRPKPSVSRFRADRMAMAYDKSTSTSLGPSVIPASRQKSLQEAIRLGKIENNHLVGGEEGESGSEDEAVREVLELLSNGRIHNAGPVSNGHIDNAGPTVMRSTVTELSAGSARSTADTVNNVLGGKMSRFKAERM
jgi:hypothetical protein